MLTAERLKEVLIYDPITGIFTWRTNRGGHISCDRRAGTLHEKRLSERHRTYRWRCIRIDKKLYMESHLAWLYMTGEFPTREIDHKNNDGSENYWLNLRLSTSGQNNINQRIRLRNKSGFKGVREINGRYRAKITSEGREIWLGLFSTPEAAAAAYFEAAKELYGEFANAGI